MIENIVKKQGNDYLQSLIDLLISNANKMKKRLNIKDLEIKSFVTSIDANNVETVKGGIDTVQNDRSICDDFCLTNLPLFCTNAYYVCY